MKNKELKNEMDYLKHSAIKAKRSRPFLNKNKSVSLSSWFFRNITSKINSSHPEI